MTDTNVLSFNGERMREVREQRGWSMRLLAMKLKVAPTQVLFWEKGRAKPRLKSVTRIAKMLDISQQELLGYAEKSQSLMVVTVPDGKVKAGEQGCIAAVYWDPKAKRQRLAVGYVGEGGIKADTWYEVKDGKFSEVREAV